MGEASDLPQRTNDHVLETASRRHFEVLIPAEWTSDEPRDDYGVDLRVEIFAADGTSGRFVPTGGIFDVQLKATGGERTSSRSIGVKWATVAYWTLLPHPVLIVRYYRATDQHFGVWLHEWFRRTVTDEADTQTARFNFGDSDELTTDRVSAMGAEVADYYAARRHAITLPLTIHVTSDVGDELMLSRLQVGIQRLAPNRVDLVHDPDPERRLPEVRIDSDTVEVSLGGGLGLTVDTAGASRNLIAREDASAQLLLILAQALAVSGAELAALELLAAALPGAEGIGGELTAATLGALAHQVGRRDLTIAILELTAPTHPNITMLLAGAVVSALQPALSDDDHRRISEALDVAASSWDDACDRARGQQSLGVFERQTGHIDAAIAHYTEASKLDPDYLNRAYFWSDLGGMHFDLAEWDEAVAHYERAIELGANLRRKVLLADSLLAAGRYADARTQFDAAYAEDPASVYAPQALLSLLALDVIVEDLQIEAQLRDTDAAKAVIDEIGDETPTETQARAVLHADALYPPTWMVANNAGLVDERALIFDAWLQRNDPSKWVMAYMIGAVVGSAEPLLAAIADQAWFHTRDDFEEVLLHGVGSIPRGTNMHEAGSPAAIVRHGRRHVAEARRRWAAEGSTTVRLTDGSEIEPFS